MTPHQFAPGDRLLIEAVATDVAAARLSRGENAWLRVGPGDVVEASGTVTDLFASVRDWVRLAKQGEVTMSEATEAILALFRAAHAPRVPGAREAIAIVIGRALIDGSRDHGLPFSERVLLRSERAHEAADAILALIANQPAAPVVANEEAE